MVRDYSLPMAKKALANVHPDKVFSLKDGSEIKNLKQLYVTLNKLDQNIFDHHVTSERNDFGNWIKDVHKDYKLANMLFSAKNKAECVKAVGSRLYEIQKTIDERKSARQKETETAAERLEKILTDAMRAKMEASPPKKKKAEEEDKEETVDIVKEKPKTKALAVIKNDPIIGTAPPVESRKSVKNIVDDDEEDGSSESDIEEEKTRPAPRIKNEPFKLQDIPDKKYLVSLDEPQEETPVEEKGSEIVQSMTAQDILVESIPEASVKAEDPCEEMLKFTEMDSEPKQVAENIKSLFSKPKLNMFKGDSKKSSTSKKAKEKKTKEEKAKIEDKGDKGRKEQIISHLKKVYGE